MSGEEYIEKYGEHHRRLIVDTLAWLNEREPIWKLDEPIDRDEFIHNLISDASSKVEHNLVEEGPK